MCSISHTFGFARFPVVSVIRKKVFRQWSRVVSVVNCFIQEGSRSNLTRRMNFFFFLFCIYISSSVFVICLCLRFLFVLDFLSLIALLNSVNAVKTILGI